MVYRRRRKRLIWFVVLLIVIVFLNFSVLKSGKLLDFSRRVIITTLYPFQYAAKATFNGIRGFFADIIYLRSAQKENRSLKKDLELLRSKLKSFDELVIENNRIRSSLKHKASSPFSYRLLHAEIISWSASNWFNEFLINRGEKDGVRKDMAVMSPEGLVGRIVETTKATSKVLLIIDPSSSISVLNQRSRDLGIIIGGSSGPLSMKYVTVNASMMVGDLIVTSGMSEIFPRGIVVGKVISVSKKEYDLFQKVVATAAVNFSKLEDVFVIIK